MAIQEASNSLARALVSAKPCRVVLSREREKLNHNLNQLPQEPGGTSIKIETGYAASSIPKHLPYLRTKPWHLPYTIYPEI